MKLKFLIILIFALTKNIQALDQIACKYGTDKSSYWHNYISVYESYFSPLKDKKIKFLEIGFAHGQSAHMWEEYFSKAELHFLEFNDLFIQCFAKNFSDRSNFHLGDQSNENDLNNFINKAGGSFDIIIDDGGHQMNQQITSFKVLFPHLKSGGIYVIEDLHTSYWKAWGGSGSKEQPSSGTNTTIRFLQSLIDEVNFVGARTGIADKSKYSEKKYGALNYYQRNIKSLHFYDSMCFIIKN